MSATYKGFGISPYHSVLIQLPLPTPTPRLPHLHRLIYVFNVEHLFWNTELNETSPVLQSSQLGNRLGSKGTNKQAVRKHGTEGRRAGKCGKEH